MPESANFLILPNPKCILLLLLIFSIKINNNLFLIVHNIKKSIKEYINLIFFNDEIILSNNKFFNITKKIKNIIRIGIYTHSLSNGGVERNTALILNYLSRINYFELYLFNDIKNSNEYKIPLNAKRIIINYKEKILQKNLLKYKIDIFIYQLYDKQIITMLKTIKNLKIIFYIHSCFLYWIYKHNTYIFNNIYSEYQNSKYVVSLIPFENEYLFKKWEINSIYMNNFLTYEYERVIQSDLSSKNIVMIGRADDKNKRFDLGIKAMKYIIKEINTNCQMIIISDDQDVEDLKDLIKSLYLVKYIKFTGYIPNPEIYFKNISLHIFPSIAEAFPMTLSEIKIYGIPTILVGIDYISTFKGGVITIYDENPETIAKFAVIILKNKKYRKILGKEARKSMKKFDNEKLFKKWMKLILVVYKGENLEKHFLNENNIITENESIYILHNQINLLKKREKNLRNITLYNILNFSFVKNLKY